MSTHRNFRESHCKALLSLLRQLLTVSTSLQHHITPNLILRSIILDLWSAVHYTPEYMCTAAVETVLLWNTEYIED